MRIISGKYKGRKLEGHQIDGTRPTQDRVKESMFSMIQEHLKDAVVLDLFAGSANLGIEALSNGAKYCYFVDHSPQAIQVIRKNLEFVDKNTYSVSCMDYQKALKQFAFDHKSFDLVFLDPPYQDKTLPEILTFLVEKQLLKDRALVVCELEHDTLDEECTSLQLKKAKKYGYKQVKIYQLELESKEET